jgi:hypothetical protein
MMKIHPIEISFNELNSSIKNTAKYYIEGRDLLIRCLARNSKRTELEVINWLRDNNKEIFNLEDYDTD